MLASTAGVRPAATSVDGLSASLSSTCEITWPSVASTNAVLEGVGRIALMTSLMPSSATAPLMAPVVSPARTIGAVKAT